MWRPRLQIATLRGMTAAPGTERNEVVRERVFTPPLVVFLIAVLTVLGFGLSRFLIRPDATEAIELLADGDADGEERQRLLRILVEDGQHGGTVAERWAGALAAVALGDRQGLTTMLAGLGGGPVPQPLPDDPNGFLHLGDPMLRNLLAAWRAEAAGAPDEARVRWRQIAAQCRFLPHPLAAELAAAGQLRLP